MFEAGAPPKSLDTVVIPAGEYQLVCTIAAKLDLENGTVYKFVHEVIAADDGDVVGDSVIQFIGDPKAESDKKRRDDCTKKLKHLVWSMDLVGFRDVEELIGRMFNAKVTRFLGESSDEHKNGIFPKLPEATPEPVKAASAGW